MRLFSAGFFHEQQDKVGVLLMNLGTPDAPKAGALRRYLRQFLSDQRVVELPRWRWLPILFLFVLTVRPKRSAALYRKIWRGEGSPLLVISQRQAEGLEQRLKSRFGDSVHVRVAMRYGQPAIPQVLRQLAQLGCRRILLFPLFPQYASATTGSALALAFAELATWRWVPEVRTVGHYHDHPGYIQALATSIKEAWRGDGPGEKLLFSFHGVPLKSILAGDPYFCHCLKTARLVAASLGLAESQYEVAFQSKFGREPWLEPATVDLVSRWGREKLASLDVVCPGFAADCLETLEEIAITNREVFHQAGGGNFRYIAALNDRPDHLDALAELATSHLTQWLPGKDDRHSRYLEYIRKPEGRWGVGL
ncbi:MAG: ferrochelatase [Thermoanaerobaculaceae bacterium]